MLPDWVSALRGAVFAACLSLFLAQSYKEVQKYFRNHTSTSIHTYDEEGLGFPVLVFCRKVPFRTDRFVATADDYLAQVFGFADVFDANKFAPSLASGKVKVTVLDSLWYGRCYSLKYSNVNVTTTEWVTIGLSNVEDVNIALMEEGQEVCILFGICPDPYPIVELEASIVEFWLSARKKIRPKRLCHSDGSSFDQYSCLRTAMERELERFVPCALPFYKFAFSERALGNLTDCQGKSQINESVIGNMALTNALIRHPEDFGCGRSCHRWIYEVHRRNYDNQAISNIMGPSFNRWKSTIWLTFLSPTVEVMEEHSDKDFNGILASLGGSLGLFLGFSCFDCLAAAVDACGRKAAERKRNRRKEEEDDGAAEKEGGCRKCSEKKLIAERINV